MLTAAEVSTGIQLAVKSDGLIGGLNLLDVAQLVGTILTLVVVIIAIFQLNAAKRTARCQLILMIDESLHHYEDVRTAINNRHAKIDTVKLRRYVAPFERLGIMLQLNQIDLDRISQPYASRMQKLLENEDARRLLEGDPEGWQAMIYLWQKLYHARYSRRRFPEPPKVKIRTPLVAHDE